MTAQKYQGARKSKIRLRTKCGYVPSLNSASSTFPTERNRMRPISLAARLMKLNRNVLPCTEENPQNAVRLTAIVELTSAQRSFVAGGPEVENEPD